MADKKEEKTIQMTESELEGLIKNVINETLSNMGIETSDKTEIWKDFLFMRQLRETHEAVKKKVLLTLVGALVLAAVTGAWMLIKR